ncbi:hypothetical protein SASPL_134872 [Salvia splendens]|uniref:cAMP-regulated phosphoprotein 19-related protein n=1 Tax=Salvia splendens TaxID=180675 RepID=A0A8X8WX49_SALSN|nr:hypothetical protein SASPL_134872 [Salvia splendens]
MMCDAILSNLREVENRCCGKDMSGTEREQGEIVMEDAEKSLPTAQKEEAVVKKKYGGMMPKKPPLISKDHERAYFDSADWALGKQGAGKPKGPLEALRPKLQDIHRHRKMQVQMNEKQTLIHLCCGKNMSGAEREQGEIVMEDAEKSSPTPQQEEAVIKKKYGGMMPKKPPLISKDHERAYFDSADWALGKQGASKPKGPLEALRPKLQPSQQQTRYRKSQYAPSEGEGLPDP